MALLIEEYDNSKWWKKLFLQTRTVCINSDGIRLLIGTNINNENHWIKHPNPSKEIIEKEKEYNGYISETAEWINKEDKIKVKEINIEKFKVDNIELQRLIDI